MNQEIKAQNDLIRDNYGVEENVTGRETPIRRPFRFWRWVRRLWK